MNCILFKAMPVLRYLRLIRMAFFFKKSLLILALCFTSFFLLDDERALSEPGQSYASEYQQLIEIYQGCLSLENEVFKKLTFKLHRAQLIKRGIRPKLTLEDNLGREWIFKFSLNGIPDKPVIAYRISKLFGIECPEIHPITLNINGKDVYGSIQRLVPNKGTLVNCPVARLSLRSINYLMDTHVLFWLLGDYDAHASNFIILYFTDGKKLGGIMRVDNDMAFNFSRQDDLNLINGYNNSWVDTYYYVFWKDYISKKAGFDIKTNYAFVKFVENFPDWFMRKLMQPLVTKDPEELAGPDFSKLNLVENNLLEAVISRKKQLSGDFSDFYRDLADKRREKPLSAKDIDYKSNIAGVCDYLRNKIDALRKEERYLSNKSVAGRQTVINAVFSLEGFKILSDIYKIYWIGKSTDLPVKCDEALKKLYQLKISAENKYELSALKLYIVEAQKIREGGAPSVSYNFINSIVNPALLDS